MAKIDINAVIRHLEAKWGPNKNCPLCNVSQWTVNDSTAEIREHLELNVFIPGLIPLVVVNCENCGNTILLNALTLGLVRRDDQPSGGRH